MRGIFVGLCFVLILSQGCGPDGTISELSHEFGENGRPDALPQSCKNLNKKNPIDTYLNEIVGFLISNSGEKSRKVFAHKKPCITSKLLFTNMMVIVFSSYGRAPTEVHYAGAEPLTGDINISPEMIIMLQSEQHLAAVLAHELAHISMGHFTELYPGGKPEIASKVDDFNKRYLQYTAQFDLKNAERILTDTEPEKELVSAINDAKVPSLNGVKVDKDTIFDLEFNTGVTWEQIDAFAVSSKNVRLSKAIENFQLRHRFNQFVMMGEIPEKMEREKEKILALQAQEFGEEFVANWVEENADDVGLQNYLRAGYSAEAYRQMIWRLFEDKAATRPKEYSANLQKCKKLVASHQVMPEPKRGTKSHPSPCWRIWNVQEELKNHNHQITKSTAVFKPSISFDKVKEYIRANSGKIYWKNRI